MINLPAVEDYFMFKAFLASVRSRDEFPIGAVITDMDNNVLAEGSNGVNMFVAKESVDLYYESCTKNAIDRCHFVGIPKVHSGIIYITSYPNAEEVYDCMKFGLNKLYYFNWEFTKNHPRYLDKDEKEYIEKLARAKYLTLNKYIGNMNWARDLMNEMKKRKIF